MEMEHQHIPLSLYSPARNRNDIEEAIVVEDMESLSFPKVRKHFIEANTKESSLYHLKNDCIVPVFSKDNEITISHTQFIETVQDCAGNLFRNETILEPEIRVSHMIKGRTPEAIHKAVNELVDTDKTIYYERMAFCMEIPSITANIGGNQLHLTVGGVRAYNQENLYSKKGFEKFKVFIGFKNLVCCNMCVSTDGYCEEIRVTSLNDLMAKAIELFVSYNAQNHLNLMNSMQNYGLSESQFAQIIGKSRMYQYLPAKEQKILPAFEFNDSHINQVVKSYYRDQDFGVDNHKTLSLWKFYNLLTGANKLSYIDTFLNRSVNATSLTSGLGKALDGEDYYKWFLE